MLANYETYGGVIEVRVDFEELNPRNRHAVTIKDVYGNIEYLPLYTDTSRGTRNWRYFFKYGNERIYVDEFLHVPFERINNTNGLLDGRVVALSMLSHGIENVGVYMELPCFDYIVPQLGIGILGDKRKMVLCKVTERSHKVCQNYKVELTPAIPVYQKFIPNQRFFMEDFAQGIRSGNIVLVDLKKALAEEHSILERKIVKLGG